MSHKLYNKWNFIYPPRPENRIPPSFINNWDNNKFLSQPKIDGSNAVIIMDENSVEVYNRHGKILSNVPNSLDFHKLYRGEGFMVLNGEYLNKNKSDENNEKFNKKLIIFDILVYNSEYLLGDTFNDRILLMDSIYGEEDSEKPYLYKIDTDMYRVKSFYNNFSNLYNNLSKIDLIEGLVIKKLDAKLEPGIRETNNNDYQIKVRKSCNNYSY